MKKSKSKKGKIVLVPVKKAEKNMSVIVKRPNIGYVVGKITSDSDNDIVKVRILFNKNELKNLVGDLANSVNMSIETHLHNLLTIEIQVTIPNHNDFDSEVNYPVYDRQWVEIIKRNLFGEALPFSEKTIEHSGPLPGCTVSCTGPWDCNCTQITVAKVELPKITDETKNLFNAIKTTLLSGGIVTFNYKSSPQAHISSATMFIFCNGYSLPVIPVQIGTADFAPGGYKTYPLNEMDQAIDDYIKYVFRPKNLAYKLKEAQIEASQNGIHFDLDIPKDLKKIKEIQKKLQSQS